MRPATLALAVTVSLISLLVFLRALSCGFVDYDDPDYILNNPLIRTFDWNMLAGAFREPHVGLLFKKISTQSYFDL